MAQEEKKIQFTATGNLSDFMKRITKDGETMYKNFAKEAASQTKSEKEKFKLIRDNINALKEQLRVEKEITREKVRAAKEAYGFAVADSDSKGMGKYKNALMLAEAEMDRLGRANRGAKYASTLNVDNKRQDPVNTTQSVFSGALLADVVSRVIAGLRTTASASTGLDLLSPMASMAGGILGGATGSGIDTLKNAKIFGTGLGDTQLGPIMAKLGSEAGGFFGDAITRSFRLREQFSSSSMAYRGLTGSNLSITGASGMGFDAVQTAQLAEKISRSRGGATKDFDVSTAQGLSRGFGVGEDVSMQSFALERQIRGSGTTRMQRTLGIAIAEGLDRAKFTDALQNSNSLLSTFAQTQNIVGTDRVNQLLFEFNKMGGMMRIGDPRSMTNIGAINQALSNPSTPFAQAQNYGILRRLNPKGDMADLVKMQEQGLTPEFLKGVIDDTKGMSSNRTTQRLMLKNRLGVPMEVIDTLLSKGHMLGSMGPGDFEKILPTKSIVSEGEKNTASLTRMGAEVSDAFRDNFITGIKTVSAQFAIEMGKASDEIAKMFKEKLIDTMGTASNLPGDAAGTAAFGVMMGKWLSGVKTPNKNGK